MTKNANLNASQDASPFRLAILAAGAANMYCGSCLHDNALARALIDLGGDVRLVPTYTPLRTDEPSESVEEVLMGGINVYLSQKIPGFHRLPAWMVAWLDHPRILQWATSRGIETDASQLGPLCVSMLRAEQGPQRREVEKLVSYFQGDFRPDGILFSNLLIAGASRRLKQAIGVPIVVTLQGDDIFLDGLPDRYRDAAIREMQKLEPFVDAFVTHSDFYASKMSRLLRLPQEKMIVIPLGLNTTDFAAPQNSADRETLTVGYLARIDPPKGLRQLCQALRTLISDGRISPNSVELRIAGYMSEGQRDYLNESLADVASAGGVVNYIGEVDRAAKVDFLQSLDLFCVPSPYEEPKALYLLEAMACGIPVLSPRHGVFPELLADTGGGELFAANDIDDLATKMVGLLADEDRRHRLATAGRAAVMNHRTSRGEAVRTLELFQRLGM